MADKAPDQPTVTQEQAAKLLMITPERIRQLGKMGYIPKVGAVSIRSPMMSNMLSDFPICEPTTNTTRLCVRAWTARENGMT